MNKEMALIPAPDEFTTYQQIAKTASQSQLFAKIGGEAGLLSIMLMARELGLPPLQSIMGGMNVIQGKVELSPRLMNSMIRKAGHKIEILESTDQICKLRGVRHDTKEDYVCSFSIDDARRASLVRSGGGWEKFASDMLFARCLSRLARRLFADVISTAYIEGELGDELKGATLPPEEKGVIEIKPEPKPPMTVETLIATIKEADPSFTGLALDEYLEELSSKKGVGVISIMEQALTSDMMRKSFTTAYKRWYERKHKKDEADLAHVSSGGELFSRSVPSATDSMS